MAIDKSMNILIVDDFQTMIRIIQGMLQRLEFNNVDTAISAKEALEQIEKKTYGLIISDLHMEGMTGIDLLKEVRSKGNEVPFIMVTAEGKMENVKAAREAGVTNYIVKPFSVDTLKTKLSSVLGNF